MSALGCAVMQNRDLLRHLVVALLHCDGADGSTTFTDEAGHTFTANGNAQLDDAQAVFGPTSGLFDGAGDFLSSASSSDWSPGAGDLTIEGRVRLAASPQKAYLCGRRAGDTASTIQWGVYTNDAGLLEADFWSTSNARIANPTHPTALAADSWYYWAMRRNGNDWNVALAGVPGTTVTASGTVANAANALRLGVPQGGFSSGNLNGRLDDFRITKGAARSFDVPTLPFPNF
jgi:type IV secretory pathway TrbL component